MRKFGLMVAALSTTGCTSLEVAKVYSDKPATRQGIPYEIPMTQFEIGLEYAVENCGPKAEFSAKAKIVETRITPDSEHRYSIDPDSLQSLFKTSDVKVEYHPNGSIKSLNASAEDKTGDFIANIGSAAVKFAKLAAGGGGAAAGEMCTDTTLNAVQAVAALKPKIEIATNELETATEALKKIREKITALGSPPDAATSQALSAAYDRLVTATSDQKKLLKQRDEALEKISYKTTLFWPQRGSQTSEKFAFPANVAKRWVKSLDDDPNATKDLDLYISITPLVGFESAPRGQAAGPGSGKAGANSQPHGIPYRKPEDGWLRICGIAKCGEDGSELRAEQKGKILQLGLVYYLQCISRPFTSITCGFELTENGMLVQAGSSQKSAVASATAKAVGDIFGSAGEIATAIRKDPEAELKKKTAYLKAEAEYRAALKALDEAPANATQDEIKALNEQADLAKAKLALIEAEAALQARQQ